MPPDRMGFDVKALRATRVVALATAVVMRPAWPAGAEVRSTGFASPRAGDVLSDRVPIEVSVTWNGQRPDHVDVRLVGADGARIPDTEPVRLTECHGSCQDFSLAERQSTWSGATFDPATLAPFASGGSRCNGAYGMQVRPQGADWGGGIGVVVSIDPSAPTDVTATVTGGQVEVSWRGAPQPDVTGYTVQRRQDFTGSWDTVTEVGAQTTTVVDGDAPTGNTQYRVATFRGDGFDSNAPVAACTDAQRDLVAAASPVTVQVPEPSSSPSDGGSASPGSDDSDDSGGGSSGSPNDGADGEGDGAGGEGDGGDEDASSGSPQPSPRRRAPATSVQSGSAPTVSVPDVSSPSGRPAPDETHDGDGEGFSEELDFGELQGESRASGDDEVAGTVSLDVPGGGSDTELALRRVLVPVAGGMIMLAFGLHLRRWTRDALAD